MDFFLENNVLSKDMPEYKRLLETGVELACFLYERHQDTSEYKIIKHSYIEDGISKINYILGKMNSDTNSEDKISEFFSPTGIFLGCAITMRQIKDSTFEVVDYSTVKKFCEPDIIKIVENIYKDFFVVKKSEIIKDRDGNEYTLKIIENSDSTICDVLYIDEVMLFKGQEKIGYLKAKYTTPELLKKYNGVGGNDFVNIATIDYSRVKSGFQGKGLGYIMYFHMAQHLNNKNIELRQSTICSPSAKRLWDAFEKNCSSIVSEKDWNSGRKFEKVKFLNIASNLSFSFDNKVPKISRKI